MFRDFREYFLQEDHPNIQKALEAADLNMKAQLELYFPKGLNLRSEDIMAQRMSTQYSVGMVRPKEEQGRKTRWSRLDHFIHKPTKFDELMEAAKILLKTKREEENNHKEKT